MRKLLRRITFLSPVFFIFSAIFLAVLIFTMSGCTVGNTRLVFGEDTRNTVIFSLNEENGGKNSFICDLQKAYVYLLIAKAEYEEVFGENVYDMQMGSLPMEDFIKNSTLSELLQRESIRALASSEGIGLSDKQLAAIRDEAEKLYENTGMEALSGLNIKKNDIEEVFISYAMSELIYDIVALDVGDTQISDSEAKVITVQYIKFNDDTEIDIEEASENFYDMAALLKVDVVECDICRGELAETLGGNVEKIVFALDSGKISDVINAGGYSYIFKSICDYDAEKTEKNKEVMLEKRKQAAFLSKYNEFMEKSDYSINYELWNAISLSDLEGVSFRGN